MGFEEIYFFFFVIGSGIGELFDVVIEKIEEEEELESDIFKIVILG